MLGIEIIEGIGKAAAEVGEKVAEVSANAMEAKEGFEIASKIEESAVILQPNLELIKETSLESLSLSNIEKGAAEVIKSEGTVAKEAVPLTAEQKALIQKETGWSREIIDCIENIDQYEIYKNAGLHEGEVNGRKCLLKDIDPEYADPKTGLTNRELMADGKSPIDAKTGEKIELHHMGQDFDSPFAELSENTEHGDGKDTILHDKKLESWRNEPEKKNLYNNVQRPNHWKTRAMEV